MKKSKEQLNREPEELRQENGHLRVMMPGSQEAYQSKGLICRLEERNQKVAEPELLIDSQSKRP